jgi:hypothetical protein
MARRGRMGIVSVDAEASRAERLLSGDVVKCRALSLPLRRLSSNWDSCEGS